MRIHIENYKNIKSLDYDLLESKLNLLFGLSGTGKSSISQALTLQELEFNKKVDSEQSPVIMVDNRKPDPNSVKIFNSSSCNDYLLDSQLAQQNITSVIIDDEKEYKGARQKLEDDVKKINDFLIQQESFYQKIKETLNSLGVKKTSNGKFSKTSSIQKVLTSFLKLNHKNSLILKNIESLPEGKFAWLLEGNEKYRKDDNCPFCNRKLTKKNISLVDQYSKFDNNSLKKIKLSENQLQSLGMNEVPSTERKIQELDTLSHNAYVACEDYEKLQTFINQIFQTDYHEENLKPLQFSEEFYHLFSGVKPLITSLNNKMETLASDINKARTNTIAILRKQLNSINKILSQLDIPYEVMATYSRGRINQYYLHLIKDKETQDRTKSLSEGEKIIISLIFFIFATKKSSAKLIIIDDPVSSFDSVKRGYLFNLIKDQLQGKTVLLLSHDSVFVKYALASKKNGNQGQEENKVIGNVSFFDNYEEKAKIASIENNDVGRFEDFVRDHIVENPDLDNYVKALCVRLMIEGGSHHKHSYQYLSEIIHGREPKRFLKNDKEAKILVDIEKVTGIELDSYSSCDYQTINPSKMTILEKAVVLRELDDGSLPKAVRQEINDYVHLNYTYIVCVNPFKFPILTKSLRKAIEERFPDKPFSLQTLLQPSHKGIENQQSN